MVLHADFAQERHQSLIERLLGVGTITVFAADQTTPSFPLRGLPRPREIFDALKARIAEKFADRFESVQLLLPYDEGGRLAELYGLGAPIEERVDGPEGVLVRARLPRRELRRFAPYLVAEARDSASSG